MEKGPTFWEPSIFRGHQKVAPLVTTYNSPSFILLQSLCHAYTFAFPKPPFYFLTLSTTLIQSLQLFQTVFHALFQHSCQVCVLPLHMTLLLEYIFLRANSLLHPNRYIPFQ